MVRECLVCLRKSLEAIVGHTVEQMNQNGGEVGAECCMDVVFQEGFRFFWVGSLWSKDLHGITLLAFETEGGQGKIEEPGQKTAVVTQ